MKSALLILVSLILLAGALWAFFQSSGLLVEREYLAGLLHIFVGFATLKAGVEFCRFAIILHLRSR